MEKFNFDFFCATCTKSQSYRDANCITSAVVKRYKKGEYIVYKGETASAILMVAKGKIVNHTILDSGISLISIERQAPYPLGAVALFAPENHFRIDSIAAEECEVGVISRERIEEQIARCKTFMRNFIADNAAKVDIFSRHLSLLSQKNIKAKLAFYIFSVASGRSFELGRSMTDLATYFCVERPSLSRALKELMCDGVISCSRGKGKILDVAALKNLMG